MTVPATPPEITLVKVEVKDAHHAVATFACPPGPAGTKYRWFHPWGSQYAPHLRLIEETDVPQIQVGLTAPFYIAPGHDYPVSVEAFNAEGASVPHTVVFPIPAFAGPLALGTPIDVFPVTEPADDFEFDLPVVGPAGTHTTHFVLDTGAFEMLLTGADAKALGAPNLGAEQVGGVGGSASAYKSQVTFTMGGRTFTDVECVVDDAFSQNLFGARLLIDDGLALFVDAKKSEVGVYEG